MYRQTNIHVLLGALWLLAGCSRALVEDTRGQDRRAAADAGVRVEVSAEAGRRADEADLGLDTGREVDADRFAPAGMAPNACFGISGGGGFFATACDEDADCEEVALGAYRLSRCHPTLRKCGQCAANADCIDPALPVCALHAGDLALCSACDADSDCQKGPGNTGLCNLDKQCDRCLVDQDCVDAGLGSLCGHGHCEQCADDADCTVGPGNTGRCGAYRCTRCTTDVDCETSGLGVACDPLTGRCLQCVSNSDCVASSTTTRYCHANRCLGCETHADCATLAKDHFCAPGA